jgi:hypothetical protein
MELGEIFSSKLGLLFNRKRLLDIAPSTSFVKTRIFMPLAIVFSKFFNRERYNYPDALPWSKLCLCLFGLV